MFIKNGHVREGDKACLSPPHASFLTPVESNGIVCFVPDDLYCCIECRSFVWQEKKKKKILCTTSQFPNVRVVIWERRRGYFGGTRVFERCG